MNTHRRLAEIAATTDRLEDLRPAVLDVVRESLDADVGMFVTKLPGHGVGTALSGFTIPEAVRSLHASWDTYGDEVTPVREEAMRTGAATDLRTLGAALYRQRVYRDVMAPHGGTESLFIVPALRGLPLGMLMVGRCGGRFSEAALAHARGLGPSLAVGCAAVLARAMVPEPRNDLSSVEGELLSYLELGYTTREIAVARGTSFYTVRNQLSGLYRKLDVTNRTEAVMVAMGHPSHR